MNAEFTCANGKHITYHKLDVYKKEKSDDFFVQDMKAIIKDRPSSSTPITEIYYITAIENPYGFESRNSNAYKLKVFEMLREFINKFPNKVIMLRLGYNDDIMDKKLKDEMIYKMTEEYAAAISAGFYDISNLICLEFSKTLLYNTNIVKDIIELSSRCEAMLFIGTYDTFSYDTILNKIYS